MEKNYLQEALYDLVSRDPAIIDFLHESSLDGQRYRDLQNPENELMNSKTSCSYGVNGLGLTILKEYSNQLNGNFGIESKRGEGKVSIPVSNIEGSRTEHEEMPSNEKNGDAKPKNKKTILVADDEFINYLYLYELLKTSDNEVIHAINGQDAVNKCMENEEISLVLMDIRMPVMNGDTAARAIKEFRKGMPIIAQTAYTPEDGFNMDVFDDCLTKPVRREALREKVKRYL